MANNYKTFVDLLIADYSDAMYAIDFADSDIEAAWSLYSEPTLFTCVKYLIYALEHITQAVGKMQNHLHPTGGQPMLLWALQLSWQYEMGDFPEFEITPESIVEAWIRDDFKGRAITIATIDRMRQILWDEPFNALWSAKPEEQEL